jgi:hypothetical protein
VATIRPISSFGLASNCRIKIGICEKGWENAEILMIAINGLDNGRLKSYNPVVAKFIKTNAQDLLLNLLRNCRRNDKYE